MNKFDEIMEALIGMRDYEKGLFEIYSSFSQRFNEHKDFWHTISIDENTHALMVDTFIALYKNGDISFYDRDFNPLQIKEDVNKLNSFKQKMRESNISSSEAIKFALQTESSVTEEDLYRTKDSDPPEFKKFLTILYEDSKKHYDRIKKLQKLNG